MKFLLAEALVYNDEDGSISLVDAPDVEPQVLTTTANSIMKLLVKRHGNVVEREAFLREVWDERGLQGSNNSLNQYISILRKILAGLVPETPFIVTVPKMGFMLSADITVQPQPDRQEREASGKTPRRYQSALLFCGGFTVLVVALCVWMLVIKQHQQHAEMHLLTHIGECPVYTFSPLADVFHSKAIALAQAIQRDGNLPCLKNSIFYLHIQNTLFYGHEGRLVLSQCSLTKENKASTCRTLYYYEW
ncbi:winged helix-turn-helix domain-containing protein [Enterobacter wuhouensis]|mgnify:FL=1|jgi:DNA-binding winged helix-turn-helix (wHTH) protein|uniref:Winged helix family transcriptional regulator n=1 Tax=Enterobacter wuhouensis TaxID=2529381 RepID=A0A4R0G6I9_9ENTR|nr:winged helix-turn-helix domain-containing protein [Enterobacter wuhouensis]TCB92434.1 winged helix family transcriptional regulator [Enterobacter wuhouensis]WRW32194.1 winged helix-turn-helix domain-containing protein [Enterobacter wuhouensis]